MRILRGYYLGIWILMDIDAGIVRIWIRILCGLMGIYIYITIDMIIDKNNNMDIGRRMVILYGLLDSEFRGYYTFWEF